VRGRVEISQAQVPGGLEDVVRGVVGERVVQISEVRGTVTEPTERNPGHRTSVHFLDNCIDQLS
jgi:hypothetical protein